MREIILGVAIAWGIYKTAMLAAALVAPIMTLVKAIQMLAAGQKLATVAQWAFNAAANPIVLIVTAKGKSRLRPHPRLVPPGCPRRL